MPQDIRLWEIGSDDGLCEIKPCALDQEARLENWLEKDITLLSDDLLVIGRQVETDYGGIIDLLCLARGGDLVLVELKRGLTPREVTAQVLDYASWVKDLSHEKITDIARKDDKEGASLEELYRLRFGEELPEVLNENHRMLIVASRIDASTERIVGYLSDPYGIAINAVTFQHFADAQGKLLIARVYLLDPSQVAQRAGSGPASKRKSSLTLAELRSIAYEREVGELFDQLESGLIELFDRRSTTLSSMAFGGLIGSSYQTVLSLFPSESSPDAGVRFQTYGPRLATYLGMDLQDVRGLLPVEREGHVWSGTQLIFYGQFRTADEVNAFLTEAMKRKRASQSQDG